MKIWDPAQKSAAAFRARQRLKDALPLPVVASLIGIRGHLRGQQTDEPKLALRTTLQRFYPTLVAPDHVPSQSVDLKVYSQFGEDGRLLDLFSRVGVTTRTFIEIGVGDGRECNTANLALTFGWSGVMIDGSQRNIDLAQRHYRRLPGARVKLVKAFVTAENVNDIVAAHESCAEIDLLSVDIDGMDYWIWDAFRAVSPRVVVVEYNAGVGVSSDAVTPYRPDFDRFKADPCGLQYGASLAALTRLGQDKGYVLAGCSAGLNAFFVRADAASGLVEAMSPGPAHATSLHRTIRPTPDIR